MKYLPKIKTNVFRHKGYVRAYSIIAEYVVVNGFIEVTSTIRANKLLVVGGIKAKNILADTIVLNLTSPSTILDLKTRVLKVVKRGIHGRLYCSIIDAEKAYLTYTHTNMITARRIVLSEGCIVDKLVAKDNCILRINTPYCSFRTNPLEENKFIKIILSYHNTSLRDPF